MTRVRQIPELTRVLQRRASDPDQSVWVSANAGSGKTHVLAQRVLRLLLRGTPPGKILCLTFTKAAAANMAARVFERLAAWALLDDTALREAIIDIGAPAPAPHELVAARRLFARTVETPGGLKIQTIHAFCERLLHLFPFEANVPARFEVVEEMRQADLMERARRLALAAAARDEARLGTHLRRLAGETSGAEFDNLIAEALRHRAEAGRTLVAPSASRLRSAVGLLPGASAAAIERAMIEEGIAPSRWSDFVVFLAQGGATDQTRAAAFEAANRAYDQLGLDSHKTCVAAYLAIFFNDGGAGAPAKRLATSALEKARPDLVAELYREQTRLIDLRAMHKAAATVERTEALMGVVDAVLARYDRLKAERGLLDFADLIERTLALLHRSDAQWVLYKLDSGIDHVLVDEAQDTSAAQWKIFESLTSDFATGAAARSVRRSFFAVGDDKQSIFSFQGAAPLMFHAMRGTFEKRFHAGGELFEHVRLKASFRSVPGILATVDRVFGVAAHQAGLVHDGDVWPDHESINNHLPGLVELWPVVRAETEAEPSDWRLPLDMLGASDPATIVAQRVAQKIGALIAPGSGERVCDSDTGWLRPVRPGDVLILVRTRGPFFTAVIRALKQNKVPVAGADRLALTEHIATMDLVAAGRAALLPQDDLTLACVLKSPLIGLDDDDLLAVAPGRQDSLYEALAASPAERHRRAVAKLEGWRRAAAAATPFGFYMRLLSEEGGRHDMETRLGPEACDAIDEFLRLALQHEREAAPSLATFLAELERIDLSIKRDMETGADSVRVMTVHAAKGLEAKIVCLPDTCGAPGAWHDPKIFALPDDDGAPVLAWSRRRDLDPPAIEVARAAARQAAEEEHRRLLYVALTRAEERLYIAGFVGARGPQPGCWSEMIEAQLAGSLEPVPAFWNEQAHIFRRVTPGSADLMAEAPAPAAAPSPPLPGWLTRNPVPAAAASTVLHPSHALSASESPDLPPGVRAARREALRRGGLVHTLLQYLPGVDVSRRGAAAEAFLATSADDLTAEASSGIVAEALAVVDLPALAPLFGRNARAEIAVAGRLMRGPRPAHDVAGRIDRLVETDTEVIVADFKTGTPPAAGVPAAYVTQLALYHAALAPLWPKKPVRMLLVWTEGPRVVTLDEAAMRQALAALA